MAIAIPIISAGTSSTWRSVLFARFAAIEAGEGGLLTFALTLRSAAILIAAIGSGGHALRQRGGTEPSSRPVQCR